MEELIEAKQESFFMMESTINIEAMKYIDWIILL